jgi:hypothetical protein
MTINYLQALREADRRNSTATTYLIGEIRRELGCAAGDEIGAIRRLKDRAVKNAAATAFRLRSERGAA